MHTCSYLEEKPWMGLVDLDKILKGEVWGYNPLYMRVKASSLR